MSLVTLSVAHRIFDQNNFDSFIRFVTQHFIETNHMIRIEIKFVYLNLESIFDSTVHILLQSVNDICHLAYIHVLRGEEVQYPYNRIITSFSDEVTSIFILQLYFSKPHETIHDLNLFFGLNEQNTIIAAKELCWNEKEHKCFEIKNMGFYYYFFLCFIYI